VEVSTFPKREKQKHANKWTIGIAMEGATQNHENRSLFV